MSTVEEPYEENKTDQKPEVKESKAIVLDEHGQLLPTDHQQLKAILKTIAEGGGLPSRFDTLPKQIAAYNLARALMADRWQLAVNNIASIHGQMTIYGELPRTLAEETKEVSEFHVYVIDKNYKRICLENENLDEAPFAGVCEVQRGQRMKNQFTYTLKEAEKAGQYPPTRWDRKTDKRVVNEDSPWLKYTKVMLMRKAQALGVKFTFPEALAGAKIAEYDFDELPDYVPVKDVTPVDKAKLVNEKFTNSPQVSAPAGGAQ